MLLKSDDPQQRAFATAAWTQDGDKIVLGLVRERVRLEGASLSVRQEWAGLDQRGARPCLFRGQRTELSALDDHSGLKFSVLSHAGISL